MADGDRLRGWPLTATTTTLDGIAVTIFTVTPGIKKLLGVRFIAIGRRYDVAAVEADAYYKHMYALITTATNGVVTVQSKSVPEGLFTGAANYIIDVVAAGTAANFNVQGIGGGSPHSVRWHATTELIQVEQTITV